MNQEVELILGNTRCHLVMGDHSLKPSASHAHIHPRFELFFVWRGEVEIITEHQSYHIGAGKAALIAPQCYHQTYTEAETEKFNVHFSLMRLNRHFDSEDTYAKLIKAFSGSEVEIIESAEQIGETISALKKLRVADCFLREERLRAELTKFILELYDLLSMCEKSENLADINQLSGILYRDELDILLAQNFSEEINLDFLADALYLSPKRVSKLIKSLYGKSFRELKTEMRIQVAKQMLKESNLTIDEIGKRVGYNSTRGFLSAFYSLVEMTPSEYRKTILSTE